MEAMTESVTKAKRILVVEDEPGVRTAVCLILSIDDHQTTEAANGVEALSIYKPDVFDLVLTDLRMPLMKGNELALRIRKQSPHQPIIMLTGFLEENRESYPYVDEVLYKPTSLAELRRSIAAALTMQRSAGPSATNSN